MPKSSIYYLLILLTTIGVITTSSCQKSADLGPVLRLTRSKIYYARTNTEIYDLCAACEKDPNLTKFTAKGTVGSVHYYIKVFDLFCVEGEPVRYKVTWLPTSDTYVYPPPEEFILR